MDAFYVGWITSAIVLLFLAGWIGKATKLGTLGILIDTRGRYSLTHFQTVLWTIIILSSLLGVLASKGLNPQLINLPPTLLGLMGISAGSGVLAMAAKGAKDTSPSVRIARAGMMTLSNGTTTEIKAHLSQIWLEEEGDLADKVVSITKFQNFIFTLVIVSFYIATAWKQAGIPDLPENIVWLIGISHAGYVGGKVPNKK